MFPQRNHGGPYLYLWIQPHNYRTGQCRIAGKRCTTGQQGRYTTGQPQTTHGGVQQPETHGQTAATSDPRTGTADPRRTTADPRRTTADPRPHALRLWRRGCWTALCSVMPLGRAEHSRTAPTGDQPTTPRRIIKQCTEGLLSVGHSLYQTVYGGTAVGIDQTVPNSVRRDNCRWYQTVYGGQQCTEGSSPWCTGVQQCTAGVRPVVYNGVQQVSVRSVSAPVVLLLFLFVGWSPVGVAVRSDCSRKRITATDVRNSPSATASVRAVR